MPPEKRKNATEPWKDPFASPYLIIDNVSKDYQGLPALNHISLEIYRNEFFSLLGPSGCGKSTLLRILAGFEQPSSGRIEVDGQLLNKLPPYERPVNMMFQSYALFPHLTVEQNVMFGLKQEGVPRDEREERVAQALKLVRMHAYAGRRPHQLSGGQRQRVALARSLVKRPKLLLLDEPMAALDRVLRQETQFELVNIQEKVGITFIMVTHDQEEAMTMSTRMGVMEEGRIRQVGSPQEVYEYPNSRYVADFIGTMNIFEGMVKHQQADHVLVECPEAECDLYIAQAGAVPAGSHVSVAIRPEKVMMSKAKPTKHANNTTKGIVDEIAYLGDVSIYYVRLKSGKRILVSSINQVRLTERAIVWEDEVYVTWAPQNGVVLAA